MPIYVESGVTSNDLVVQGFDSLLVLKGGTANNTTIKDYGNMYIWSGGTANGTTINSGSMRISSGGTANGTTINSGGIGISSGGIANYTTINFGGSMTISSGGTANRTTINGWGVMGISSDATANSTTINSSGYMAIRSGGTANRTTINSGGSMTISSGGTATNITANSNARIGITVASNTYIQGTYNGSAFEMKEAFISGYTINDWGSMYILSGGTANSTTINSGGSIWIFSGGTANSTTINSGGMSIWSGGTATNIVENGGHVYVADGAYATFASNTIEGFVLSYGSMTVHKNTIANSTTINDYGYMAISSGGTANGTTINSRGAMYIASGGTATNITANTNAGIGITVASNTYIQGTYNGSAFEMKDAFISGYTIHFGGYMAIEDGGTANSTTINDWGSMYISSGGTANSTTINSGGSMYITSGGTANSTTVNSRGSMWISSGGTANSTTINGDGYMYIHPGGTHRGSLQLEAGAVISAYSGSTIDFTVADRTSTDDYLINNLSLIRGTPTYTITVSENQAYGTYKLAQGASSLTGTISVGTEDSVYGSVTVNGADLIYDGTLYSLDETNGDLTLSIEELFNAVFVYSAGTLVSSGAAMSGVVISGRNHTMEVSSGGIIRDTTVNSRGNIYVGSGGYAIGTVINSRGNLTVENAIADKSVVNLGGQLLADGNTIINDTLIDGGHVNIYNAACTANRTNIQNSGTLSIEKGSALDTVVNNNGILLLSNGAVAKNTTFGEGGVGAVLGGGILSSTTITGAALTVSAGGSALDTTVSSGGNVYLAENGIINDMKVLAGGTLHVLESAEAPVISGTLTVAGNVIAENDVAGDYTIVWSLADVQPANEVMINSLAHFATADFSITVDADQAHGTYLLADGVADSAGFSITIGTGDSVYGSVTVNGADLLYNGITYSADQVNGELTLFIGDITPPEKPVATANTTAFTNQNVTVTATYTADSAVKQYKIGDGAWQDYTGKITVTENATIYFRAADVYGNISEITEYVVSNIDKVAPDQPTADADIKETTYDGVTITATYTADSAVKQYKIGDGAWQDYTGAFMVSENATIYFRAKDAAGNYSEITEYVVNNIIKKATIDGSGMTHAEAVANGCELIVTTGGTYSSNIGHDGVEARIEGGTFNCTVGGGALTASSDYVSRVDREGDTNMTITGGTFNKVVMGGDRVNYGNCDHVGDLNLTINGGMFNSQIVGGMAYTDKSARGEAYLSGDIYMTLAGGTFKSRIYGGCISTAGYSTCTTIDGNVNIVVDSSENELIFADNVLIVAGSYQSGEIYGNVQVTFTGLGENLKMDADNQVWGGCSSDVYLIRGNTRTFKTMIEGSRTICFNDFSGAFNTIMRGFDVFKAENGSKLEILANNNLRDIEQWELDWDTCLSGSFQNDFSGDTMAIDLTGWDQTATDLFDCASGSFRGFDAMEKVTLGGESAVYSEAISGYVSENYMLTLRNEQTMQLSMNTTIA